MDPFASFAHLTDPRVQGRCLHQLVDILALLLCGTLAGCDDLPEICDYGRARLAFLRTELGLAFANGIPSEDTLERLLKRLNPKELEQTLRACAGSLAGRQLCVDGKEHRATTPGGQRHALVRTVSVWVADAHLSFGQAQIEAKTNEKTAIPALLDTLDVAGSIVTIDAIACQPSIVGQVVANGADYVIALKKNAKTLYEQASEHLLARAAHLPAFRSQDKGHGRGERRTVRICQDLRLLDACADWPSLRTLVLVETERHTGRGVTHAQRFYLSSLTDPDPAVYARLIRGHWAVENHLHWQLDLTFKEDQSRLRSGHAALNANILRKTALYLLAQDPQAISLKRKRKQAAYDNEYLRRLLQNA
ncbi:ISAs1 family transposase [Hymenobacter artigasi]|uniref:ISAs1 family transposase n=1 Tax=Hymenobacter artigasi TaxID=2719616 RepID=UPI001447B5DC|nr:ISAs1 family transposase [Hymenobacter artigasi]